MALINSSQIQYPLSGTFSGSFSGDGSGLTNLSVSGDKISSGSITASVSPIGNLFLIKSVSTELMTIISGTTTITNDIFLIKNNTGISTFKISESIIYLTTQSVPLTGPTLAGSMYFTSSSFYVGLEN